MKSILIVLLITFITVSAFAQSKAKPGEFTGHPVDSLSKLFITTGTGLNFNLANAPKYYEKEAMRIKEIIEEKYPFAECRQIRMLADSTVEIYIKFHKKPWE